MNTRGERDAAGAAAGAVADMASPCVSVCVMMPASGLCAGCFRTLDEIAAWGALDAGGKRAVLARLPARQVAHRAEAAAVIEANKGARVEPTAKPGSA